MGYILLWPESASKLKDLLTRCSELFRGTYYCLQCADLSGGVGVGVGDELVEDELVVEWEVLDVDDSDDEVVLGGFIVSVQDTVDISFDVEDRLEELDGMVLVELEVVAVAVVFCWTVDEGREELVVGDCDEAEGPAVPVPEGPVTVAVPDLVAVMNVEELVLNIQDVVVLGLKVEWVIVGSVPLSPGV